MADSWTHAARAGAVAALVWAAVEPAYQRMCRTSYSDVGLVGLPLHVANGALFGVVYHQVRRRRPVPAVVAAVVEHVSLWPLVAIMDPAAARSVRAFASSGLGHATFGLVLGRLER